MTHVKEIYSYFHLKVIFYIKFIKTNRYRNKILQKYKLKKIIFRLSAYLILTSIINASYAKETTDFMPTMSYLNTLSSNGIKAAYYGGDMYFVSGDVNTISDTTTFYTDAFLKNIADVDNKSNYSIQNITTKGGYTIEMISDVAYANASNTTDAPVFSNSMNYYTWSIPDLTTYKSSQNTEVFDVVDSGNDMIVYYGIDSDGNVTANAYYYTGVVENSVDDYVSGNVIGPSTPQIGWHPIQTDVVDAYFLNTYSISGNPYGSNFIFNGDFINNTDNHGDPAGGAFRHSNGMEEFKLLSGIFLNNGGDYCGGAIYNDDGKINNIVADFVLNKAKTGGAIYTTGQIDNIVADFIGNNSSGDGTISNGGAIYNTGIIGSIAGNFINNRAEVNGGAIYNHTGDININSYVSEQIFSGNIAENGGAIYNYVPYNTSLNGGININTNGGDLSFLNNTANKGGAIYNDGGIININALDGNVLFSENTNGAIVSTRYNTYSNTNILNINAYGGDVIFNNNPDGAIIDYVAGEINLSSSYGYKVSFLTNVDDLSLDDSIINITSNSFVDMYDVIGTGTINNNHGVLKIYGTVGPNIVINNYGGVLDLYADYVSNVTSTDGILTLIGGTLNNKPNQERYEINGNVFVNTSLANNIISVYGSLTTSANNISGTDITNRGTLTILDGVLENFTLNNVIFFDKEPNYNGGDVIIDGQVVNANSNLRAGNIIINTNNSLTINASNLEANNIINNGILYLGGGHLYSSYTADNNITGIGYIVTMDNIYGNASNFGNKIENAYNLTLSGGTLFNNVSGVGNLIIDGQVSVDSGAFVAQNIIINPYKQLSISASNINSNIVDNGTLVLTGGTLTTEKISGNGNILITGNVTSEVGVKQALQIVQNASLNINANNILYTIVNNGTLALSDGTLTQQISGNINIIGNVHTSASNLLSDNVTNDSHNLTLTGGTLAHSITGAGNTIIDGEVVISDSAYNNIVAITNNISINSGAKLYAHANALQNNVQNSGNLHLTGGMLDFNVTGGNTIIDGNIDNKALLNTSIIINNTKTLSTTADNIAGQVNNNGTLALNGGILNQQIIGNGTININAEVHSSAANLLNNVIVSDENALTLTGGTLSRVINTTGQGKVVIDGHVSTAASNLLTDVSVNAEKILTLSGGTLDTKITGTGLVEIDGMVEIANNKTVDTNVAINTDKSLTASINSIGGAVINNGLLTLTDGGTLSGVISGSGNIVAKANVDKITTSADYLQNPLQLQSSATKVVLTDGTLNNKINGGSIVVAGNVKSHANNIGTDVSNTGTFVLTGGVLAHNIYGTGDFEIDSGTLTTSADRLHMSKITNNGVLDITSGILNQDIDGGKTIIANGAGISSKNIGDLELHGNMYVGNNTITAANTAINGTVNMDIEKISANSNNYVGGHLIADNVSLGDNSKLNLTIYNTDLLKGESTGDISLISTNGDWSGSFGSIFQNNNRYSISFDDTTKTFAITHVKIGADVIAEAGGTNDDIAVASAWDDLPSSTLPNVQRIIDEINHRSQHDTDGYLQLVKSLQPVKTNVVHGVSRSVNNAINTQITERLSTIAPIGRNGGDMQAKSGVWAQGMYNKSNQSGDYGFNGNTIGVIAGFDTTFGTNITMGGGYAFSTTDIEADMRSLEVDGHNLFIYGKYQGSNWHVNANLSYGMSDYTDNATALDLNNSRYARRVFPTQNTKSGGTSLSDSEYSTNTIGASALFGYGISENLDINIGTRFNHITVDDYIDMAGQSVSIDDMNFMTVLGGCSYGKQGQNWTPVIHVAATYDVLSDDYIANVDLGGSGYVINGENIDPFGIEAGISLETHGDIWDFSIGYDIEWHSNFISHTGKAKLKYNF